MGKTSYVLLSVDIGNTRIFSPTDSLFLSALNIDYYNYCSCYDLDELILKYICRYGQYAHYSGWAKARTLHIKEFENNSPKTTTDYTRIIVEKSSIVWGIKSSIKSYFNGIGYNDLYEILKIANYRKINYIVHDIINTDDTNMFGIKEYDIVRLTDRDITVIYDDHIPREMFLMIEKSNMIG